MGSKLEIEIVDELPSYYNLDYAVLGNFSLSTRKVKYIAKSDVITYDGISNTPPYHFRKQFEDLYLSKANAPHCHTYPYYAIPGRYPYCFYIDIRRAYLQIARAYGAECHVFPGKTIAYGQYDFNEPLYSVHRIARGLIVSGTGEEIKSTIWEDGNYHTKVRKNSLYAPHLRASIMNTLHAIAHVLKRYVVYWHTDGCIVPFIYEKKVSRILDQYGFTYAIKHEGPTEIFGVGSYTVGSYSTMTPRLRSTRKDYVLEDNPFWYLVKFAKSPNERMQL
jgi:hypothetical protein